MVICGPMGCEFEMIWTDVDRHKASQKCRVLVMVCAAMDFMHLFQIQLWTIVHVH